MDRLEKFTDRARKVLTLAQDEAQRFNHNYIGTEHLLLGLVREGEGLASQLLRDEFGLSPAKIRQHVIQALAGYPADTTGSFQPVDAGGADDHVGLIRGVGAVLDKLGSVTDAPGPPVGVGPAGPAWRGGLRTPTGARRRPTPRPSVWRRLRGACGSGGFCGAAC